MNQRPAPSGEAPARKRKTTGKQQKQSHNTAKRSYGAPETTGLSQLSDIVTLAQQRSHGDGVPLPVIDINRDAVDQVLQYSCCACPTRPGVVSSRVGSVVPIDCDAVLSAKLALASPAADGSVKG